MKDLRLFGTAAHPLHPSGMRALLVCPWRAAVEYLEAEEGESGQAADTGSATHAAVEAMHSGRSPLASLESMRARASEYSRADLREAAAMFLQYQADPRNASADVVICEKPIFFSIAPTASDPTGAPIEVVGTLDQVRREAGRLRLWDVKTSKRDPMEVLHSSTFQAAAYCIGASFLLGEPVHPGGVIMPRRYTGDVATSPVFWHFPWKFDDIEQILSGLRVAVANIRSGVLWHVPNEDCRWCTQRSPDLCFPKLRRSLCELETVRS